MQKSKKTAHPGHEGKGFLALAGEAFAVLGEEIVEGKDKIVEAASDKINADKKAIKKYAKKKAAPAKKPAAKKAPAKKAVKKTIKKTVKKAVAKAVKKTVKKAAPKKKKK
jgi:hypothetical protein